jgi:hypothetical protein
LNSPELEGLPEDPELAFVALENILRARLVESQARLTESKNQITGTLLTSRHAGRMLTKLY